MVILKNVYGDHSRFTTRLGPSVNNYLEKCLGAIRIGTYQESSEDNMWAYEPVSYLLPYVDPDSESSDDDEVSKYQDNTYVQEHEEVSPVSWRNPRRLIRVTK